MRSRLFCSLSGLQPGCEFLPCLGCRQAASSYPVWAADRLRVLTLHPTRRVQPVWAADRLRVLTLHPTRRVQPVWAADRLRVLTLSGLQTGCEFLPCLGCRQAASSYPASHTQGAACLGCRQAASSYPVWAADRLRVLTLHPTRRVQPVWAADRLRVLTLSGLQTGCEFLPCLGCRQAASSYPVWAAARLRVLTLRPTRRVKGTSLQGNQLSALATYLKDTVELKVGSSLGHPPGCRWSCMT